MEKYRFEILGITSSQSNVGSYTLILEDEEKKRRLPIVIGMVETQSIMMVMEGVTPNRPLTHDLMHNMCLSMGAELLEINIVDVREAIFFANLKFQLDGKVVEVDSRPSDAIALSVRFGAPIFVSDKVIQEAGIEMQENTPELSAAPPEPETLPPVKTKGEILNELRNKMSEAIQNEDYEKAAALRDEIQKLENS